MANRFFAVSSFELVTSIGAIVEAIAFVIIRIVT